jgi:glutathione S-transferase
VADLKRAIMKLYMHPISTTSRAVMLMLHDQAIPCEFQVVDLMTQEQKGEPYASINPAGQVPVLVDGDFKLTESSAILKYIADKFDSPVYPKELKARAKVNEMMDWFNTGFNHALGYGLTYPQVFPPMRGRSDEAQAAMLQRGRSIAHDLLRLLNDHWLGADSRYLCGRDITLADYLGISQVTLGDMVRCDFSRYPHVQRWLDTMKARPSFAPANEPFHAFCASMKDMPFETL